MKGFAATAATSIRSIVCGSAVMAGLAGVGINAQATQHYKVTNLTSNNASLATHADTQLINPWGLSRSSGGPWWVSDNGTGLTTLYDGTGLKQGLVVTIPPADPAKTATGSPTGTIFNGGTGFTIAGKSSIFLFATEDGTISGWAPGTTTAVIAVNEKNNAVFKGLTMATATINGSAESLLYAADFHHGTVQVFDPNFRHVVDVEQRFARPERDDDDHEGRDGYAPFNVQNIGGDIYVAYAKQDSARFNEVDGPGLGFVAVYSPEGRLLRRFERGNFMNAPWGLALASGDFGAYSHDLLVGQFGSGEILAFDPQTGKYLGALQGTNNQPVVIQGLWGLSFGNDAKSGLATALYFAAGINNEAGGLLGDITTVENPQGNDR